jgi:gluconokinase
VVGANDGVLSNLGVNAIGPGEVAVTIGTSGAMRAVVDRPLTDPSGRTFCYALTERHWVIGGPVNNGGLIFRWVRDEFAAAECETAKRLGIDPYEILTRIAERVQPGAEGLIFHPYLAGERAPLWNANLRGSFFGLGMHHRKEHMIRAALEGVIYNLYSILPAVEALIGPTRTIKATGGFARSGLWRQMMADVFDREVVVPESFESSCLGAAVLGLYALGRVDSLEVISSMVGATQRHTPIEQNVVVYGRFISVFPRSWKRSITPSPLSRRKWRQRPRCPNPHATHTPKPNEYGNCDKVQFATAQPADRSSAAFDQLKEFNPHLVDTFDLRPFGLKALCPRSTTNLS